MLKIIKKQLLDDPISKQQSDPWLNYFKYVGAFSLIALFILFSTKYPTKIQEPQFHVVFTSFSPLINASSHDDSKYVIDWNVTLSIKNPNEGTIFMYEETRAWIYYMDELFSVAQVNPMFQGSKEKKLVPIRLTTYDHDGWLSKGIEEEFARDKEVVFDFLLQSKFCVNSKFRFRKSAILVVDCNDLRLDSFNMTNGIMYGNGGNCTQQLLY